MNLPTMYDVPYVVARSGLTEDSLLEEGIGGTLEFLVVVPELGACRVPHVALSHFLAGAEKYEATKLSEFYGGVVSGDWTIKRERLRILARSFETYDTQLADIGETLERAEAEERKPKVPSHEDLVKAGWVCDEANPSQIVTSTEVNAGYATTLTASKLQHEYLAEQRRQRQAKGLWTICEVAQLFENHSFVPDGEHFLKQRLLPAIWNDSLRAVSESDGFKVDSVRVNPLLDCLRPDDVNAWLEQEGVTFRWRVEAEKTEQAAALSAPQVETKQQRQDRRLKACIDAGLPMGTKAALSRLPDGIGEVAKHEGVKRQTFTADVKAALERRESARREGGLVHRT